MYGQTIYPIITRICLVDGLKGFQQVCPSHINNDIYLLSGTPGVSMQYILNPLSAVLTYTYMSWYYLWEKGMLA